MKVKSLTEHTFSTQNIGRDDPAVVAAAEGPGGAEPILGYAGPKPWHFPLSLMAFYQIFKESEISMTIGYFESCLVALLNSYPCQNLGETFSLLFAR